MREKVRRKAGKKASPTVAIVDRQSIRAAERGFDGGKKITGRERHLAVDTLGMILKVFVHSVCFQDYDGALFVMMRLKHCFSRLQVVFGDSAYGHNGLPAWVKETCG